MILYWVRLMLRSLILDVDVTYDLFNLDGCFNCYSCIVDFKRLVDDETNEQIDRIIGPWYGDLRYVEERSH